MGSSKKHKKDRGSGDALSKKHKRSKREISPIIDDDQSTTTTIVIRDDLSRERDDEVDIIIPTSSSSSSSKKYRSMDVDQQHRSKDRSSGGGGGGIGGDGSDNEKEQLEKSRRHHRHHHHNKKHKERKQQQQQQEEEIHHRRSSRNKQDDRELSNDRSRRRRAGDNQLKSKNNKSIIENEYHSDSSDVVEVPMEAPPAPLISKSPIHHQTTAAATAAVITQQKKMIIPPAPPIISSSSNKHSSSGNSSSIQQSGHSSATTTSTTTTNQSNNNHKTSTNSTTKSMSRMQTNQKSRSSSPIPDGGAGDCLSIEETNKLRAKLGLKPLEVTNTTATVKKIDGKHLNVYKDEWGEFHHKPAANIKDKLQTDKLREKFRQNYDKRKVDNKLTKVKKLADDTEMDDALAWVQRNRDKDKHKQEAAKRAQMLEELDEQFTAETTVQKNQSSSSSNNRRSAAMENNHHKSSTNAGGDVYRDKHLRGLKVDHNINEFQEGTTVILTLKDHDVLDEDDDALINVNMIDNERYKKNIVNKKLKPGAYGYDVYEDAYDEFGDHIERSVLSKYDEDIIEKGGGSAVGSSNSFKIGDNLKSIQDQKRRLLDIKSKLAGKRIESLNEPILRLASDVYTEEEMSTKFKKSKKKIKKIRTQDKSVDNITGDVYASTTNSKDHGQRKRLHLEMNADDGDNSADFNNDSLKKMKYEEEDNELEKILSKARRLKQKELIISKSLESTSSSLNHNNNNNNNNSNNSINDSKFDIKLKSELDLKMEMDVDDDRNDDNGNDLKDTNIILNSTAEFCRTLGDIPTYGMSGNRDEAPIDVMDFELHNYENNHTNNDYYIGYDNGRNNNNNNKNSRKNNMNIDGGNDNNINLIDDDDDDADADERDGLKELEERYMGSWNSINPNINPTNATSNNNNSSNNSNNNNNRSHTNTKSSHHHHHELTEVAILDEEPDVSLGMGAALKLAISKGYLEKEETNRPSTTRMAHLQAKNYSIEDKAYAEDEKFNRRDRYHSGPISDFKERDCYKPNVKLEYIDDNGRILNEKEAFRYLSHKFHGKGPGKNKIEKRLKKSEQDVLMMKMSSTDTPLGTLTMLQHKQKETHSPYIVLSGSKQTHTTTSIIKHK